MSSEVSKLGEGKQTSKQKIPESTNIVAYKNLLFK